MVRRDAGGVPDAVAPPAATSVAPAGPAVFDAVVGVVGAVQLVAGADHACTRDAAGAVRCWGSNTHGQLGTGTLAPAVGSQAVQGLPPIVSLRASSRATCGLTAEGAVWCWGDLRPFGAMTNARRDTPAPTPRARRIVELAGVREG